MHPKSVALWIFLSASAPAVAQVSIGIGLPGVSIGINLRSYPELVVVPGYPVYYAPQVDSNLFFYDGLYWVYAEDRWYASDWYNGPWDLVEAEFVPLFVLRIPVRYYRRPPPYFRDWRPDAPPHWGRHWGPAWAERHRGWNRWDRHATPVPAPAPTYQRQYAGKRYPRGEQQRDLRRQHYTYQAQDPRTRERPRTLAPAPGRAPREVRSEREPQHPRGTESRHTNSPPPRAAAALRESAQQESPLVPRQPREARSQARDSAQARRSRDNPVLAPQPGEPRQERRQLRPAPRSPAEEERAQLSPRRDDRQSTGRAKHAGEHRSHRDRED